MATFGDRRLLVKYDELPKVNGRAIHAIYGRMETAYSQTSRLSDAYDQKPDYYLLVTDDRDYKDGKWSSKKDIMVRELPSDLAKLFGKKIVNGYNIYVTRMHFRTQCSGHGGFIDDTVYISGGCGALSKNVSYYRCKRWESASKSSLFEGEELAKPVENVFGKKYKVDALPEDFDHEYPVCYIRKVGGLNYPDTKLTGWRRSNPYVANAYLDNGSPDRKNIRVYYEPWDSHVYLTQCLNPEVGDELVRVEFPDGHGIQGWQEGNEFCNVRRWSDSKIESPSGMIKWKVLSLNTKNGHELGALTNEQISFKKITDSFIQYYKLVNIQKV